MKIINRFSKPIVLDDGTILAAAGTGSTKEVESITDRDRRRYVATGRVAIIEPEPAPAPKVIPEALRSPAAAADEGAPRKARRDSKAETKEEAK